MAYLDLMGAALLVQKIKAWAAESFAPKGSAGGQLSTAVSAALSAYLTAEKARIASVAYIDAETGATASMTAIDALLSALSGSSATYTPEVLKSDYSPSGASWREESKAIDFASGDYVECVVNCQACSGDRENLINVGSAVSSYDSAVGVLVYWRESKILVRLKDVEAGQAIDRYVEVDDPAAITVKVQADGIYVDGAAVRGMDSTALANIMAKGTYTVGSTLSVRPTCVYDHVTIYRKD